MDAYTEFRMFNMAYIIASGSPKLHRMIAHVYDISNLKLAYWLSNNGEKVKISNG